jgi:single-stranded-DNA-specific exonuclease
MNSTKEWIIKDVDRELAATLADECELPKPIATILAGRDIDTKEKAEIFIDKPTRLIRSPSKLPDCGKAVDRLKKAIQNEETIFVWGDYDVDGITSTSVIVTCFEMFGAKFIYKVPNRFDDGYDIKRHSVDECVKVNATLLLSVDCGIVAFDTAEYAKEKGIDVIITDHHTASEDGRIPDCVAVVNPSRIDSEYGFAGLCGATVAFKLMLALGNALNYDLNKIIAETIEFVALGTVADVAPMMDENRILVHKGCQVLSNSNKPGIQELLKIAGAKDVDTTTIGFGIGPRMNAIGRLSDPMIAVELMLEKNQQRAKFLATQLDTANKRRQSKQEHMLQEAIALIETEKLYEMPVIVCWAKSWHAGLIGLMAGKIADRYHRPAVVLALNEEGKAKGSCRSVKSINILQSLKHSETLKHYSKKIDGSPIVGGHAFAAGMEVPEQNLKAFRETLCEVLQDLNPDFVAGKKVYIADSRIVPGEINDNTFDALMGLAPFGSGHPEPVFWVKNLTVQDQKLLSSDKHLKLTLFHERVKYKKFSALLWHKAADYPDNYVDKNIDVLFSFGKETRGFGAKFYLNMVDFRLSD